MGQKSQPRRCSVKTVDGQTCDECGAELTDGIPIDVNSRNAFACTKHVSEVEQMVGTTVVVTPAEVKN